jgi:general secretion pathway protein C
MLARLAAFVVWALVAATAVFWGMRLFVRAQPAPSYAVAVGDGAALRGDLTRLLGATPVAAAGTAAAAPVPELAARFKLLGLMAGRAPKDPGFALIAVDSKPARAYAVGAALDGELVLQSVSLRSAAIGPAQGTPALTLEIPPLPAPSTGTLPAAGSTAIMGAPPTPVPPRSSVQGNAGIGPAGGMPPPPAPLPGMPRRGGANTR